jgi:hypothetical protein
MARAVGMQQGLTREGAVRLARERLGEATAQELAAHIREAFGLAIKPEVVTVLLGSLQERAALDRTRQAALEKIERWRAENPREAKQLAAVAKRREAARRRRAEEHHSVPAKGEAAP